MDNLLEQVFAPWHARPSMTQMDRFRASWAVVRQAAVGAWARVFAWQGPGRSALGNLIFPPQCALCGADLGEQPGPSNFCGPCLVTVFPPQGRTCLRCHAPVPEHLPNESCPLCEGSQFHFQGVRALGVYRSPLLGAVLRMKHYSGQRLALAAGRLLAVRLAGPPAADDIDLVAPVPAHWRHRLWHGVNAPDLLAEAFAASLRRPYVPHLLVVRRRTARQSTLTVAERWHNVRGVYGVSPTYDIKDCRIALIDDVLTTGATASQAAWVLKQAGAASVQVFVVARGIGSSE